MTHRPTATMTGEATVRGTARLRRATTTTVTTTAAVAATTRGASATRSDLLGVIMREHREALLAYAERMTGDHGLAEDIVQETAVRAWRNIDRLVGLEGSVRGWLFTVTRHLVIDSVRRPHARREVVGCSHEEPSVRREAADAVRDGTDSVHDVLLARLLLRRLSPEHRAVLVHIYLCDRTIQETAGILGVPLGTVKSRQHHALRKLRAVAGPRAA